jgi:hypothetical protein
MFVAHDPADADATGLGERLEAGGDVDAVAEDVAFIDDDVADIDADAKLDAAIGQNTQVAVCHLALHLYRAARGVDDARELDQEPVTGRLDDPAMMLSDLRIDQLPTMRLQAFKRAFLVASHQARVASNVGRQDGCQPPIGPLALPSGHCPDPDGCRSRWRTASGPRSLGASIDGKICALEAI